MAHTRCVFCLWECFCGLYAWTQLGWVKYSCITLSLLRTLEAFLHGHLAAWLFVGTRWATLRFPFFFFPSSPASFFFLSSSSPSPSSFSLSSSACLKEFFLFFISFSWTRCALFEWQFQSSSWGRCLVFSLKWMLFHLLGFLFQSLSLFLCFIVLIFYDCCPVSLSFFFFFFGHLVWHVRS